MNQRKDQGRDQAGNREVHLSQVPYFRPEFAQEGLKETPKQYFFGGSAHKQFKTEHAQDID
jgi:hypothetical protein